MCSGLAQGSDGCFSTSDTTPWSCAWIGVTGSPSACGAARVLVRSISLAGARSGGSGCRVRARCSRIAPATPKAVLRRPRAGQWKARKRFEAFGTGTLSSSDGQRWRLSDPSATEGERPVPVSNRFPPDPEPTVLGGRALRRHPAWRDRHTDEDRRGLSALSWTHVNLYLDTLQNRYGAWTSGFRADPIPGVVGDLRNPDDR
jgi:hypothetical protein